MSQIELIAVTDAATGTFVANNGFDLAGQPVRSIEAYGCALLIAGRARGGLLAKLKRKAALRHLVEIQRLLETLMKYGPILPAVQGAAFKSEEEALGLLATSHRQLTANLANFGKKAQFQVTISWVPEAVLRHHADLPQIQEARQQATGKLALGRAIQRAMEALRAQKAAEFLTDLEAVVEDTVEEPLDGAEMVLNRSVLINPEDEANLDRAVEAIDAQMPDQLRIKLVGPYPAVSFAGVKLERFAAEEITAASSLLGVQPSAAADKMRAAYIDYVKQCHPDLHATDDEDEASANEATDKANRAYHLLKSVGPFFSEAGTSDVQSAVVAQVERSDRLRSAA